MKKERGWEVKEVGVLQAESQEELWENQFNQLTIGWVPYREFKIKEIKDILLCNKNGLTLGYFLQSLQ